MNFINPTLLVVVLNRTKIASPIPSHSSEPMLVEEMTRVVKKSMVGAIDPNRPGPLRSDPGDHKDRTGRSSDGRELLFIELGSVIDVNRCRYRSAFQGVVTRHSDCGLATAETNR